MLEPVELVRNSPLTVRVLGMDGRLPRSRGHSRCLLGATLAATLAATGATAQPAAPPPPNVLVITIDTLRPDALGFVAGRVPTPAIDSLAATGFAFVGAVSPVPLTLPAHTSLFTGLVPSRHGVRDNGQVVGDGLRTLPEIFGEAGYSTAAFVGGFPLLARFGLDRGFEHYDDELTTGTEGWLERPAAAVTERALAWLSTAPEPWVAWVHYYDPHDPYEPAPPFTGAGPRGAYDGEVRTVDAAVAVLLEQLGSRADLTVLTADHGESLGEHREGTHGYFVYDSTVLVPLVFRFDGVVPTGRSALPARLVDVAPTILELSGLGAGIPPDLDGVSLVPLLAGEELALPPALVETHQPWISYGWAPLTGLRTDSWKLIVAPRPELYDLRRDPRETVDLYAAERPTASELARELRRLQARSVASSSGLDDPEALATLRSLGYLGTASPGLEPTGDLPDPKDRLAERDLLATGESLLRQGNFVGALELFGRVLEREPGNRFATLRSGIALLKANEPARAVPFLQRAAELDPAQAETRFALADALTRTGRLDEAAQQWLETVRLQPRRVAAWANLGTVLAQSGKLDEAVKALGEAVELDPADGRLRSNLAFALRGAGRTGEALEALLEAERLAAEGAFPYAPTLGLLLLERGRPAEALPRLETAAPGALDYAAARVALARLYLERDRRRDAESALRAALDADPSLAESLREDPLLGPLLESLRG